jgi:hypothetical protein
MKGDETGGCRAQIEVGISSRTRSKQNDWAGQGPEYVVAPFGKAGPSQCFPDGHCTRGSFRRSPPTPSSSFFFLIGDPLIPSVQPSSRAEAPIPIVQDGDSTRARDTLAVAALLASQPPL